MALTLECPNCGCNEFPSFLFRNNGYICKCCGQYTYEKKGLGEDEVLKLSRCDGAYREIRSYRFSEAKRLFEDILRDYPDCVEAHWGLIQAKYGIVYVKGFYTGEVTPIYCFPDYDHDNIEYITDQPEYEALMELLADDDERRALYEKKSKDLDEALDIFADSKEEEPIDVFLCVKISQALAKCPELTEKTELDFPKAQELREKLTAMGKKVFFSYKNLSNNLESDMDIWKSLVKSRKMLLITSSRDYLESVWVRSEWERWLSLGGEQQNNLYIYLLGDAKKLSRRLPPELKGRQFYTEETEEKLIADLCFDPEADRIEKEKAEKEAEEKQKEELQKQFQEMMRKQLEEIEKANREKQELLLRKIAELEKPKENAEEDEMRKKFESMQKELAELKKPKESDEEDEMRKQFESMQKELAELKKAKEASAEPAPIVKEEPKEEIVEIAEEPEEIEEHEATPEEIAAIIEPAEAQIPVPAENGEDGKAVYADGREVRIPYGTEIISAGSYKCTKLSEIVLPESVKSIGYGAFYGCAELEKVTLPEGLENIGEMAFFACSSLKEAKLPKSVKTLGNSAFCCSALTDIRIPENVERIGKSAFSECRSLEKAELANGVKIIDDKAFASCVSLTSVNIPDGVTKIGACAFNGCTSLCEIHVPESVEEIGLYAFGGCDNISVHYAGMKQKWSKLYPASALSVNCENGYAEPENNAGKAVYADGRIVPIPHGTEIIPAGAYKNTKLKEIVLPEGVKSIGYGAFYECAELVRVVLPEGLETIGEMAFFSCTALEIVNLPESVRAINNSAFCCTALTKISIPKNVERIGKNAFCACKELSEVTISHGVMEIEDKAFSDTAITKISIPESVKRIGTYAFSECRSLAEAIVPAKINGIGAYAFRACPQLIVRFAGAAYDWDELCRKEKSLATVKVTFGNSGEGMAVYADGTVKKIPYGTTAIEASEYRDNTKLVKVVLPYGVTSIKSGRTGGAFSGCTSLVEVELPETLTEIGSKSFSGCTSLIKINIPNKLATLGTQAFAYCKALETIVVSDKNENYIIKNNCLIHKSTSTIVFGGKGASIPQDGSIKSIGKYAFCGTDITSAQIPAGVSLNEGAFMDSGVTSASLSVSVRSVPAHAFSGCEHLEKIEMGKMVRAIGTDAFRGCGITEISLPYGINKISEGAFRDCAHLTEIRLPLSTREIEAYAFHGCEKLESITLPKGLTVIDTNAFSCTGLTSVTLPQTLETVGSGAFELCEKLTEVQVPRTLKTIFHNAFDNSPKVNLAFDGTKSELQGIYTGKAKITCKPGADGMIIYSNGTKEIIYFGTEKISGDKYKQKSGIVKVVLPEGLDIIAGYGYGGFYGCRNLKEVVLPQSLTSICSGAFAFCDIQKIVIPKNVRFIGDFVLGGNKNLRSIAVERGNPYFEAIENCLIQKSNKKLIAVCNTGAIPEGVRIIGKDAFSYYSGAESIEMPNSVDTIEYAAFRNCSEIKKVAVSSSVKIIPDYAFDTCASLTEVIIPEGVTEIRSYAFHGCSKLKNLTIPASVTKIESTAFSGCEGLTIRFEGSRREWKKMYRWENVKVNCARWW